MPFTETIPISVAIEWCAKDLFAVSGEICLLVGTGSTTAWDYAYVNDELFFTSFVPRHLNCIFNRTRSCCTFMVNEVEVYCQMKQRVNEEKYENVHGLRHLHSIKSSKNSG